PLSPLSPMTSLFPTEHHDYLRDAKTRNAGPATSDRTRADRPLTGALAASAVILRPPSPPRARATTALVQVAPSAEHQADTRRGEWADAITGLCQPTRARTGAPARHPAWPAWRAWKRAQAANIRTLANWR